MTFIEWSDELSVGVKEIDEQHKFEVELVNKLHDAPADDAEKLFLELAEHTKVHFTTEEEYFDKFSYEDTENHKKIHAKFLEQAGELGEKIHAGEKLSEKELEFVKNWLINHIKLIDKKYTACFREHGLS